MQVIKGKYNFMKKIILLCVIGAIVVFMGFYEFYTYSITQDEKSIQRNIFESQKMREAIPVWHKKIHTQEDVKIGIITDTHVRPTRIYSGDERENAPRYLKPKHTESLKKFVAQMNIFEPDFLVHLGDIIEGTGDGYYVGVQGLQLVQKELMKARKPIYWTVGNHDLRSVKKDEFQQTLGLESLDQVFDIGDYRFIILDANYNLEDLPRMPGSNGFVPGKLSSHTLDWFKKQLETDKQVFVFVHQGTFLENSPGDIDEDELYVEREDDADYDEEGNIMEEKNIDGVEYFMKQSLANASELNDILKEYRVNAIFNGHLEARRYEVIDKTAHYSLTGTKKSTMYPQSYYELTITDGKPKMTMYYTPEGQITLRQVDFESGEK